MTDDKKQTHQEQQDQNDPKRLATIDAIALNSEATNDEKRDDVIPADAGIMQHMLDEEEEV
jgi:hypothetical protein